MQVKRKNGLKIAAITIALLLCLALAVGITGAWYQAKRQATGTLSMDQGIIIDYKGFNGSETGETWARGTTFELFSTEAGEVQPGAHIKVNAASIKANEKSVAFYARVRLEYKFYNGDTEVTLEDPTVLITASNIFGSDWEYSSMAAPQDYYYYVENGTTTFKTMEAGADFVELIQNNAEFIIEGENFVGADNNGEGGGFVVGDTSINKLEVYLTLETLQGDADPEAEGWKFATPVRFAEATGKMETSVNKTETTEDLNVSVAGATEVPINEVVFPYDTSTTLKFDSNNVEYITLTYDKDGVVSTETFEETALNTITVKADSNKGKVTGYIVGLFSSSEYTGFTFSTKNCYTDSDGSIVYYDIVDGVALAGYFGSEQEITIPTTIDLKKKDFKVSVPEYSDWDTFLENFGKIASTIQYPCKLNSKEQFNSLNELFAWFGRYNADASMFMTDCPTATFTFELLCEGGLFTSKYSIKEIGYAAFLNQDIKKVTISEGITKIGEAAFSAGDSDIERTDFGLSEIILPSTLTEIGADAFAYCNDLISIKLTQNLVLIAGGAFHFSENLTTTIGDIGGNWVKAEDGSAVDASTLLKDIDYDIKRA